MAALGTANLDGLLDRENIRTSRGGRGQSSAFASAWFEGEMDGFAFKSVKDGGRAARMGGPHRRKRGDEQNHQSQDADDRNGSLSRQSDAPGNG